MSAGGPGESLPCDMFWEAQERVIEFPWQPKNGSEVAESCQLVHHGSPGVRTRKKLSEGTRWPEATVRYDHL